MIVDGKPVPDSEQWRTVRSLIHEEINDPYEEVQNIPVGEPVTGYRFFRKREGLLYNPLSGRSILQKGDDPSSVLHRDEGYFYFTDQHRATAYMLERIAAQVETPDKDDWVMYPITGVAEKHLDESATDRIAYQRSEGSVANDIKLGSEPVVEVKAEEALSLWKRVRMDPSFKM